MLILCKPNPSYVGSKKKNDEALREKIGLGWGTTVSADDVPLNIKLLTISL